MLTAITCLGLVAFATLVYYWRTAEQASTRPKAAEPYGDYHKSLNTSQKTNGQETEWLNMGYWKVGTLALHKFF